MRKLITSSFALLLVILIPCGTVMGQTALVKDRASGMLRLSFSPDGAANYRNADPGETFEVYAQIKMEDTEGFTAVGFKVPLPDGLTLLDTKSIVPGLFVGTTDESDEHFVYSQDCIETGDGWYTLIVLRIRADQAFSDLQLRVRPRNRTRDTHGAPAWRDCDGNSFPVRRWMNKTITLNPTLPLPDIGKMKLSFEVDQLVQYRDIAPGETFQIYLSLKTRIPSIIKQLEVKVDMPPDIDVLNRELAPPGAAVIPTGDPDEWVVEFSPCLATEGERFIIATYDCVLTSQTDVQTIGLDPIAGSSLDPPEPSWSDCLDFRFAVDPGWAVETLMVNPVTTDCPPPSGDLVSLGQFRGSCYYTTRSSMSWEDAKDLAELYGNGVGYTGHLAVVTSQAEHDWLAFRTELMSSGGQGNYWLGGTDRVREGLWRWVTGEVFSYTNWFPGQPDNGYQGNEDGLAMGLGDQDQWGDYALDHQFTGLVELGPECPEPDGLLIAEDRANDSGGAIELDWSGVYVPFNVVRVEIFRADSPCVLGFDGLTPLASQDVSLGKTFTDVTVENFATHYYRVDLVTGDDTVYRNLVSSSVTSFPNLLINEVELFDDILELRNPGNFPVDYSNYRVQVGNQVETLQGFVGPDSLTVHYLTAIDFVPTGGVILLLPPAASGSDYPIAVLAYGTEGPAPSAPLGFTISRVELNLAKAEILNPDEMEKAGNEEGDTGGYNASRPTIGESNVVAPTALGSSAIINETVFVEVYGSNYIEIFNPLPTLITLDRFAISDGVSFVDSIPSTITIQPGQYHVLTQGAPGSFTGVLSSAQLYLYKYTTDGLLELVDQLGWTGSEVDGEAPEPGADALIRVPDGNALYLGEFPGANWQDCGGIAALDFVSRGAGRPNNSPSNNTHYVDQYGEDKGDKKGYFYNMTDAVNAIPSGESWTIIVYRGHYVESVTLPPNTEVIGGESDPSTVILQGTDDQPAVIIPATSTGVLIQGVHFNQGRSASGGALRIEGGDAQIRSVTFKENQATLDGGAVSVLAGSPSFVGCQFIRNRSARHGGAVVVTDGTPSFESCLFYQNACTSNGAALFIDDGNVLIDRCVVDSNETEDYYAGVIHVYDGHADVFLTQVTNNPTGSAFYSDGEIGTIDPNCSNDWNNAEYKKGDMLKSWDTLRYEDPMYCQPYALNFVMNSSSILAIPTQECPDMLGFGAGACAVLTSDAPLPKPTVTQLYTGAPNPFNPQTVFRFDLAAQGPVSMEVYDIRGRRMLEDRLGMMPAGEHQWTWHGQDGQHRRLASGVYLIRLKVAGQAMGGTQRVMLIK